MTSDDITSDDMTLVREYAQSNSEQAFATLVSRHINLVYSVALRQVRDPHLAEEIAQAVFIVLARKAKALSPKTILSGWLCRTARNVSADTLKIQRRRQFREQESHMQSLLNEPDSTAWNQIAPLLDEALNCLAEREHDAVVLRFFDGKELKHVGAAMGTTEDAARMRVNRGLEKLREFFTKRGVTLSTAAIAGAVAANSVQAAPVGLAANITATALSGTVITTTAVIAATKAIAMTTIQKTVITAAFALAVGTGIYEAHQASQLRGQNRSLQQQQTQLAEQIQQLEDENDDATNRLASLTDELARRKNNDNELLKLRGEVVRLRGNMPSQSNTPTDDAMKTWLVRVTKLKQRIGATPEAKIPEWRFLSEDDYVEAARSALSTEGDYLRALANLRSTAEFQFITTLLNPALTQYAQANNGQFPTDIAQLKPYFPSPVEDAILQRWEIAPGNTVRTDNFGDPIITQKAAVDENFDPRYAVGLKGFASAGLDTAGHNGWGVVSPEIILQIAGKAYEAANNGQAPSDSSQILPYLTTPEQQAAYQKLMIWNQQK
jgi:RNA polymerase sigma factor (sigma-70 family)